MFVYMTYGISLPIFFDALCYLLSTWAINHGPLTMNYVDGMLNYFRYITHLGHLLLTWINCSPCMDK